MSEFNWKNEIEVKVHNIWYPVLKVTELNSVTCILYHKDKPALIFDKEGNYLGTEDVLIREKVNNLKKFRENSKLTLEEVGKLLDISPSTVSLHENNGRKPSHEMIMKYSKLYKCESYEIFSMEK